MKCPDKRDVLVSEAVLYTTDSVMMKGVSFFQGVLNREVPLHYCTILPLLSDLHTYMYLLGTYTS